MKLVDRFFVAYGESFKNEMLWDVAIRKKGKDNSRWQIIKSKKRYWNADPFLFEHDGSSYVFYERYDRKKEVGELVCRIINEDLSFGEEFVVLSKSYHLSFPNVFEYNNEIYMIPETSGNHTLEVYIAENFPTKWSLYKTVCKDIFVADTIVLEKHPNQIQLLACNTEKSPCCVENVKITCGADFSIIEKSLDKEMSDYGNRNAGRLLNCNGETIRPGQDCREDNYGKGVVLYKREDSEETEVKYITIQDLCLEDDKYSGIHTYNCTDEFEVVDLRYIIRRSFVQKVRLFLKLGTNYVKRRIRR